MCTPPLRASLPEGQPFVPCATHQNLPRGLPACLPAFCLSEGASAACARVTARAPAPAGCS